MIRSNSQKDLCKNELIDIYIRGENDDAIKGIINKIASRKLAVTAVTGAAAVTGTIELTWAYGGGGLLLRGESGGGGYVG